MKRHIFFLFLLSFSLFACNDDDGTTTPNDTVVLAEDATLGKILTDANGKTLYYFSLDHDGQSVSCEDDCLDAWPIFYSEDLLVSGELSTQDFGVVTRSDGQQQTTYKGWPLYYFINDANAGDTNGEGVNDVWFVAKPDYSIMLVLAQLVGRDVSGNETLLNENYEAGTGHSFYFTDAEGNTLYRFVNDLSSQNNYTQSDFSNNALWPLYGPSLGAIPSILNRSDFGVIDVFGRPQLTYKGWPLYTFGQDEGRGDNYGVGFPEPGIWPIVNQNTTTAP